MKKKIIVLFAAVFGALLSSSMVYAANHVPDMEIEVALRSDGSAHITQIWSADTDEGTEFYLGCHDSGYLTITDFSVSDQNGSYTLVENWDVDSTFEEKANKCGILQTGDGVELCWGISQYGENRYVIEYILHDLTGSYSDADGFHHRFVDEMSFFPTDVVLTICKEDGTSLDDEVCDMWGFGFDGQIAFEDGIIRAWSESPLESGQHMTIMVSLEKGVLSPDRIVEDSFENVKDIAFADSDYEEDAALEEDAYLEEDLTFGDILILLAMALINGSLLVWVIRWIRKGRKNSPKRRIKEVDYFRDIPNDGNLNVTHRLGLCSRMCEEDTLLGAYLLRLISQGCLENAEESSSSDSVCLRLCRAPQSGNEYDDLLYTILEAAAGPDGILQPLELKRFCARNDTPLFRFMDSCERNGMKILMRNGCLKGRNLDHTRDLTDKGQKELDELLGLKRFLLEFSLIRERGVKETILWQDYMVYALMLGIADKLEPQIRDLYPEQIPQLEQYQRYIKYTVSYNRMMYSSYRQEKQGREAVRTAGSGGRISMGGGGGFSGGGGGGTR